MCPKCNSERIDIGKITNMYGIYFKSDSSKLMFPKESMIEAKVCLDCGAIFDLKAIDLKKLNK